MISEQIFGDLLDSAELGCVHPKTILFQKAFKNIIEATNINVNVETLEYKINNIIIKKLKYDPWYKTNVNMGKLKHIMEHNYSFTFSKTFIDRDKGVDMMKIMEKWLSMLPNIMTRSKM